MWLFGRVFVLDLLKFFIDEPIVAGFVLLEQDKCDTYRYTHQYLLFFTSVIILVAIFSTFCRLTTGYSSGRYFRPQRRTTNRNHIQMKNPNNLVMFNRMLNRMLVVCCTINVVVSSQYTVISFLFCFNNQNVFFILRTWAYGICNNFYYKIFL